MSVFTISAEPLQQRLTVAEAAKVYNIPRWKFWGAIRSQLLPAERLFNGRLYLKPSDIEAALAQSGKGGNHVEA